MRGNGYLFLTGMSFNPLKSMLEQRDFSFLSTKEKPCSHWRRKRANETHSQIICNVFLRSKFFRVREVIEFLSGQGRPGEQVYGTVKRSVWRQRLCKVFTKYLLKIMILTGDVTEIDLLRWVLLSGNSHDGRAEAVSECGNCHSS